MKKFLFSDFLPQTTEEGHVYHNCILGNGMEIQVDSKPWGFIVGVYDIDGRIIEEGGQPFLISLSGDADYGNSHNALMATINKLYSRALSRKKIEVQYA